MHLAEKRDPDKEVVKSNKPKKDKVFAGDEKRPGGRYDYPPEIESLIKDMRGVICSTKNCILTAEEQQTVKHFNGMCGDIGMSSTSAGVEALRETIKHVMVIKSYLRDAGKYIWKAIVLGALAFTGYGIWYRFLAEINK